MFQAVAVREPQHEPPEQSDRPTGIASTSTALPIRTRQVGPTDERHVDARTARRARGRRPWSAGTARSTAAEPQQPPAASAPPARARSPASTASRTSTSASRETSEQHDGERRAVIATIERRQHPLHGRQPRREQPLDGAPPAPTKNTIPSNCCERGSSPKSANDERRQPVHQRRMHAGADAVGDEPRQPVAMEHDRLAQRDHRVEIRRLARRSWPSWTANHSSTAPTAANVAGATSAKAGRDVSTPCCLGSSTARS